MRPSGASAPAVWTSHSQRAAAGAGSTKPQIGIHIRPNRQTPPSLGMPRRAVHAHHPQRKPAARTEGTNTGPPSKPLQQPRRYHLAIYKSRRLESNTTNTTRSPRRRSASQPAQPQQPHTAVRDLVTQPARKQQTNECQNTQPSMSPTAPTGPLTHRPETQNKAQPDSEHPTRHRAAPKANRPTARNPNTQPAPPFHMRPNGETTTFADHRGIQTRSGRSPNPRNATRTCSHPPLRRHVTRPGSPPLEPQSSPALRWHKHPQRPSPHP